ncbi:hypothetical protein C1645_779628 [Glomus cerebriforme]|uniref:Uncharacterized protein n=1 Tax=Glomus cerebriforme TaxID=658196 RepID=A0A397SR17_9GLOM|nr:hypothetical protein C1645_779628 [Glomus cerebriforme]
MCNDYAMTILVLKVFDELIIIITIFLTFKVKTRKQIYLNLLIKKEFIVNVFISIRYYSIYLYINKISN